ncbi:MAG: cobalt-precorrin-6A synthase, partial [Pseudomonadota bacterium]
GKAVKQAQGLECTHAGKAPLDLDQLAGWFREAGAEAEVMRSVASANTARQALEILRARQALHLTAEVGRRLVESCRKYTGRDIQVWIKIIDYDGAELYSSQEAEGEA